MAGRKKRGFSSKLESGLTLSQIELRARLGDAADSPGGDAIRSIASLCEVLKAFGKPYDVGMLLKTQPSALEAFQQILDAVNAKDSAFFGSAATLLENLNSGAPFAADWARVASFVFFESSKDPKWRPTMREIQGLYPKISVKAIRRILRAAGVEISNPKGGRPRKQK